MGVKVKNTTFLGAENVCKLTGKSFISYLGVPYAKPPIGELRFKPPESPDDLEDEFDATLEGDDCIQLSAVAAGIAGSEDCLYLNVHVPKDTEDEKTLKPVIVYFPGGIFNFMSGSPINFAPDYLVSNDIIVVTINYRLHVLGFLDLGLPDCPGNVGLLDQVMALKWIKNNISCFGGDPDNVTAFGTSAGAFSIHLLTLSPLTKDLKLFSKMILISGNVLMNVMCRGDSEETAFDLGTRLGYRGRNPRSLLKFLRAIPADELTERVNEYYLQMKLERRGDIFCFPFLPTIQKYTDGAIIPDDPKMWLTNGTKCPTLTGMMNKDGLVGFYFEPFLLNFIVHDMSTVLQKNINVSESLSLQIMESIKSLYFPNKEFDFNIFPESVDFCTDLFWLRYFYEAIQPLIDDEDNPVYVFEFKYDGALNCYKKYYPLMTKWIEGATHDDMLGYCLPFRSDLGSKFSNKKDLKVIDQVCGYISNFAKTGNPNGDRIKTRWSRTLTAEPCYLQIDTNFKMIDGRLNEERVRFWEDVQKMINDDEYYEEIEEESDPQNDEENEEKNNEENDNQNDE